MTSAICSSAWCNGGTHSGRGDDGLPWIVASGPPITIPGGHCGYLGGEVSGADEIVAAVRERVERRVDVVKVMASGGLVTTGSDMFSPQFSIEELRLLVEQAHAAGLPVTAHAHAAAAVDQAVAVGVERIEHQPRQCAPHREAQWHRPRGNPRRRRHGLHGSRTHCMATQSTGACQRASPPA